MYSAPIHHDTDPSRLPAWLRWQPIVVGAIFAVLLGGLFFWFATMPRMEERDKTAKKLLELREENAKNKSIVENFPQFEAEYAVKAQKFEEVTAKIPLEAEKELVSGDLERTTSAVHNPKQNLRARVTLFETGKVNPLQKAQPGMASLSEVPVTIQIRGNYGGLKRLLADLTNADRLIAVRTFEMTGRADRPAEDPDTVNASLSLVTFFKRMPQPAPGQPAGAAAPQQTPAPK